MDFVYAIFERNHARIQSFRDINDHQKITELRARIKEMQHKLENFTTKLTGR